MSCDPQWDKVRPKTCSTLCICTPCTAEQSRAPVAGTLLAARSASAGASLAAQAVAAVLDAAACADLNSSLSGYVFTAQNPSYDVTSKTWNHLQQGPAPVMPHSEPAVYVKATGVPDVLTALEFAINHRLKTSFLSNGHQFGDASLLSGGMTIDVNDLNDATADPTKKTGFFQPGVPLLLDIMWVLRNQDHLMKEVTLVMPTSGCSLVLMGLKSNDILASYRGEWWQVWQCYRRVWSLLPRHPCYFSWSCRFHLGETAGPWHSQSVTWYIQKSC